MSLFTNGQNETLTTEQLEEYAIMVKIRDSDRIDELPANYSVLGEADLQYGSSNQYGSIDSTGYFQAGSVSRGGEAVAILSDDGRIFVSFAGTNDIYDLNAINGYGDNSYLDGYVPYLETVAQYAEDNGYTIELVTGKSLGGAVVNLLADSPDVAGGAYNDAVFFAVASPPIADSLKVFNFGYDNDYYFEFYEEIFGSQQGDYATSTDNLILYNAEYADPNWSQFNEASAHSYNNFYRGIVGLTQSEFADEFEQDSFVIISNNNNVDMQLAYDRTNSDATDVYFVSPDDRVDNVTGTDVNDHVDSGEGHDIINTGLGNDVIYSGWGADTVHGGAGDDYINGGGWHDTLYGDAGNDTILGGIGNDTVYGGSGNDDINGGNGIDELHGGSGNDTIDGGNKSDTIYGDAGDDIITVGSGDTVYGGDDRDAFLIYASNLNNNDTITIDGGTGSSALGDVDDFDSLVLGDGVTIVPGSYSVTLDSDGNSYSGTMQITDGVDVLTVNFSEIEANIVIICFARGAGIETAAGIVAIESLKVGDLVKTKDNDLQPIRWIGSTTRRNIHPELFNKIAPIVVKAGALGQNIPNQDLYVSPQHRILVNSEIAKRMFGKRQVLIAAKQLTGIDGIEQVQHFDEVEYFHFLLDQHEIVYANGAEAETLFTGPEALRSVSKAASGELLELFPELEAINDPIPARFIPKGNVSRNLARRHQKNGAPLQ